MNLYEYHWTSMNTIEYHWISTNTIEYHWISTNTIENNPKPSNSLLIQCLSHGATSILDGIILINEIKTEMLNNLTDQKLFENYEPFAFYQLLKYLIFSIFFFDIVTSSQGFRKSPLPDSSVYRENVVQFGFGELR